MGHAPADLAPIGVSCPPGRGNCVIGWMWSGGPASAATLR
jgi:hypothetical protein